MNARTRKLMTLVGVVLTVGLLSLEQPISAQSAKSRAWFAPRGNSSQSGSAASLNRNCKKLKGIRIDVFDPASGMVFGTITNGGILNGTTAETINFDAGFVFTPDPNVVAYTSDGTITTNRGQLKVGTVITQSIVTGVFAQWGNINPNTSTGRFAGATGVIFFDGIPIGDPAIGPYRSAIGGEICFAPGHVEDDDEDNDDDR
jgi:hypothetical protein